ncbi:hypothetical protein H0R92_09420 [Treponema sp. OMZ 840]|uniref:hypothetical protein n=1 Tax=Treponema sp. OMZ 840 TaxID=244313 RepID=UPI003D8F41B1
MKKIVFLMLLGMTLTACSKKEAVKQADEFKLIADFRIQPEDLEKINVTEFEDFNTLYELVGAEQALKIQDIKLKGHKFNSFNGIEKFPKLWALNIEDLEITDFDGLFFNNDWLDYSNPAYADMPAIALTNTVIHSFKGLTDITNLREVSFINCSFEQSKDIVLPSQLHTLYFFNCKNVLDFFNVAYKDLSNLSLAGAEISEADLRNIVSKCPNLQYLYLARTGLSDYIQEKYRPDYLKNITVADYPY